MYNNQSINEFLSLIFNSEISTVVLYYLILFCVVAVIKNVLDIKLELDSVGLKAIKYDEKIIPVLIIIGYSGLCFQLITKYSPGVENHNTGLATAVFLILSVFLFDFAKRKIQSYNFKSNSRKLVMSKNKHENKYQIDTSKFELVTKEYINDTKTIYDSLMMNILLVILCLLVAYFQLGLHAMIATLLIMFFFFFKIIWPQIKEVKTRLANQKIARIVS